MLCKSEVNSMLVASWGLRNDSSLSLFVLSPSKACTTFPQADPTDLANARGKLAEYVGPSYVT